MSNSITATETHIEINDCQKVIEETIRKINEINTALKNKNLVGDKRTEVNDSLILSVEQLVDITAAGLVNNVIETDKYNILQADVNSKKFKNCAGHINAIIKRYLADKQKIPLHAGAEISDTELAKMIETPYRATKEEADAVSVKPIEEQKQELLKEGYDSNQMKQVDSMPGVNENSVVTIRSTSGEEAVIDKDEKAIYIKGNVDGKMVIWKKKIVSTAFTWYETAKNVAVAMFKLVWSIVASIGGSVLGGVIGVGAVAVGIVTNTATGIMNGGKSFWSNIKSASKEAHENAKAKGLYYSK